MRVLVADDHRLFRDGITSLLDAAGFEVVAQVGDGRAAVDAALSLHPDLVLMDISMPHMDGLEALKLIKDANPQIRVVMLTVADEKATLVKAIQSGADGYLLKNLNTDEFMANLQALELGEMALTRQMASQLIQGMVEQVRKPVEQNPQLTPRELELLRLLVEGKTNKEIALQLSMSENTVKYHLKKIGQKLGVQNRTEAVSYALRTGLIHPPAI
jgi:DNA-binding NarL/FixJ family response regulator